ncbi:hypothetical protein [Sporosarcina sp. HYO08]|uniref:hypothetical protein n=1 Tax=Sporosarcina sp. HYO08 TaxID=1759557 RepID=UPI0012E3EC95|nr:hypothetical protein [Sporosarcina sp. HYO08]
MKNKMNWFFGFLFVAAIVMVGLLVDQIIKAENEMRQAPQTNTSEVLIEQE